MPIGESEQVVAALRERQQPVTYLTFDYAGHGFIRPGDRRRIFTAVADFLRASLTLPHASLEGNRTMYLPARCRRTLIMGRNGAVGANHPLATQAGLDTLRSGGNAVDAAVAISLTLGVVEPMMSGLGGDGFYQVHTAKTGETRCWNATGAAPFAATPERFAARGMAVRGPLSVSTPGGLAGVAAMHAALGALPWRQLCGPAIAAARDGFAATRGYCHYAARGPARAGARRAQPRGVPGGQRHRRAAAGAADPPAGPRAHAGGDRAGRRRNVLSRAAGTAPRRRHARRRRAGGRARPGRVPAAGPGPDRYCLPRLPGHRRRRRTPPASPTCKC